MSDIEGDMDHSKAMNTCGAMPDDGNKDALFAVIGVELLPSREY
jgi:hypothetical protein